MARPSLRELEPTTIHRLVDDAEDSRVLRAELLARLHRVVEFDWYAWVLTDPTTSVGVDPLAEIPELAELPGTIRLKYLTAFNRWTSLTEPATLGSRAAESLLWREAQAQHGVVDVASVALRDRCGCWGFLDLWSTRPYAVQVPVLLGELAPQLTHAMRLVRAKSFHVPGDQAPPPSKPLVLVFGDDLSVLDQAEGSQEWLRLLLPQPDGSTPIPACALNVAAQLLAVEEGIDDNPAMARMPLPGGAWVTLRASRLEPRHAIAVTLEWTTGADRLDMFGRAHGLSPRENQILGVLATGADTAATAEHLHLSPHTVQDHLKSVFAKTGDHSRRELLARALGSPSF